MRRLLIRLRRDRQAATAVEFALVLPVALLFLLGIIDVGRLMWTWNRAEKATQMGVRFAAVTQIIPGGLASYSFSTSGGIPQGDPIPETSFGGAKCTSNGTAATCTCYTGATCPTLTPADNTAFANIVTRMQLFMPEIATNNVWVDYSYSGLGFAGDPNGSDVAPLIKVRLNGLTFTPILGQILGVSITLPDFSAALTMEDGAGTFSN